MKYYKLFYRYEFSGPMYVKFVKNSDTKFVKKDGSHTTGSIKLDVNNRGYKMLYKMGWDGKHQLGPTNGIGFNDPIIQKKYSKMYRRCGVGCKKS